ncbi:MAG: hypothetical protein Q4P66_08355 [Actinomycetaceae bacterium]|nr:hypothetical protein [Actinomycetaceae bacterium]
MFDFLFDLVIDIVSGFLPDSWGSKRRDKRARKKAAQDGRNAIKDSAGQIQAKGEDGPCESRSLYQVTSDTVTRHAADNAEHFLAEVLPEGYGGEIELEELYDDYKDRKKSQSAKRTNTPPHKISGLGGQPGSYQGSYPSSQDYVQGQPGVPFVHHDAQHARQSGQQTGVHLPPHN